MIPCHLGRIKASGGLTYRGCFNYNYAAFLGSVVDLALKGVESANDMVKKCINEYGCWLEKGAIRPPIGLAELRVKVD